jgi:probable addiction module antidote protein
MALYTEPYDTADYLRDTEDIVLYLEEAAESNDPRILAKSLATVARARGGVSELAREAHISQADLELALAVPNGPDLAILLKVLAALGLRLAFAADEPRAAA